MRLFKSKFNSSDINATESQSILNTIKFLRTCTNNDCSEDIIKNLEELYCLKGNIKGFNLVRHEIVKLIYDSGRDFNIAYGNALKSYACLEDIDNDIEKQKLFCSIYGLFLKNDWIFDIKNFNLLCNLFKDIRLVYTFYSIFLEKSLSSEEQFIIIKYMIEIRQYFIDQSAFFASCLHFLNSETWYFFENVFILDKNEHKKNIEKMMGIYDKSKDTQEKNSYLFEQGTVSFVEESKEIYLFNEYVSFGERFLEATDLKLCYEHYHLSFDKILKLFLLNKPVILSGPSGTGKSYMVKQIAKLLDLNMYSFDFRTDEFSSIKGYIDTNGDYIKTPFYDLYKYGGICFFDNIDNNADKALIELNQIMEYGEHEPYLFPNGESIYRHRNFRVIIAENTLNNRDNERYCAGKKIDENILNKFDFIYCDYDESLEKQILKDYPDVFEFLMVYRKALKTCDVEELITTRDISDIKKYLDCGAFTVEEILSIKIIKNKNSDTLLALKENLFNMISGDNVFLKTYNNMCDETNKIRRKTLR